MGSIYKRSKVFWIKYYRNGKPYRESAKSSKESDAKRLLKLREGQIVKGDFPGLRVERVRFEELAEDFLNDYRVNGKRSLNRAERSVRQLGRFFEGMRVADIATDRIRAYIAKRQYERMSNATINRELSALKRMLSLGAQTGKVTRVPYVPHLKEENIRTGYFEHNEYISLKEALPDYLKGPFVLGYYSGMRKGEILSLKWNQVDLIERVVALEAKNTKSGVPRVIPLAYEPYQFVLMQKGIRDSEYPNCPYVFFKDGHKIGDFRKSWTRACRGVGLNGKLFHDLRRTAVRNMIRAGIPERVAMTISGHRTRSVFDRYNIVNEADLKKAADRLSQYHSQVMGTISGTIESQLSENIDAPVAQ